MMTLIGKLKAKLQSGEASPAAVNNGAGRTRKRDKLNAVLIGGLSSRQSTTSVPASDEAARPRAAATAGPSVDVSSGEIKKAIYDLKNLINENVLPHDNEINEINEINELISHMEQAQSNDSFVSAQYLSTAKTLILEGQNNLDALVLKSRAEISKKYSGLEEKRKVIEDQLATLVELGALNRTDAIQIIISMETPMRNLRTGIAVVETRTGPLRQKHELGNASMCVEPAVNAIKAAEEKIGSLQITFLNKLSETRSKILVDAKKMIESAKNLVGVDPGSEGFRVVRPQDAQEFEGFISGVLDSVDKQIKFMKMPDFEPAEMSEQLKWVSETLKALPAEAARRYNQMILPE
jgi:hypothetical protein